MKNPKQGNYSINDKIGSTRMPVEGTEALRSFSEGTGRRKYDKKDPSVDVMRKRRASTYRKYGIGVPGTFGLALTSKEITAQKHPRKKTVDKSQASSKKAAKEKRNYISIPTVINVYDQYRTRDEIALAAREERRSEKIARRKQKRTETKGKQET